MRTRVAVVACILFVLVLGMMGCQSEQVTPTAAPAATKAAASAASTSAPASPAATTAPAAAAPTSAPAQPPQTLKIGLQSAFSGPMATGFVVLERWYRVGIEAVNAKGGFKVGNQTYRFEIVTGDDKFSSEGARDAANRFALSDKVKFAVGGSGSGSAGAQPVYEENKVLQLAYNVLDANLGPAHPYTFMAGYVHSKVRVAAVYSWLVKNKPQVKKIVTVQTDSAGGRSEGANELASAKANGLEMVAQEYVPADFKDTDALALRIVRANPDAIDLLVAVPAMLNPLLKSLQAQGFKGFLFNSSGGALQSITDSALLLEGFVWPAMSQWDVPALSDAEKALARQYLKNWPETTTLDPSPIGASVVADLLAQAITKAGTVDDTAKIATTLREGTFDTVWGKLGFGGEKTVGARAVLDSKIYLSKIQGGKAETFDVIRSSLP